MITGGVEIDVESDVVRGLDVTDAERAEEIHGEALVLRMGRLNEVEDEGDARREIVGLDEIHVRGFVFCVAFHHEYHFSGDKKKVEMMSTLCTGKAIRGL